MPADQRGCLTMTNALRQSKKRASLDDTNRSAAVVGAAFFSRSWNKASCLRKNRFSAASAVRLRKPVPQKLMQSETTICNVTLSFESCRKMLSTWQSSHGYPLIRLPDHVFADHRILPPGSRVHERLKADKLSYVRLKFDGR